MFRGSKSNQPFDNTKIVGLIAVLVLLGLFLIVTTNITSTVLSGARAFVDGESILSKAQKEASLSLVYYLQQEDQRYYDDFRESAEVIEVYQVTRKEIAKDDPNVTMIRQINMGVEGGRSNSEDIRNIIWMYEYLYWTPAMQKADSIWMDGEQLMIELTTLGREIHREIQEGTLSDEQKQVYYDQIYSLDKQLTVIENKFSENIMNSSIFLNSLVYWLTLCIGLLLLLAGGFVSVRFMRNIKRWGATITKSEEKFRNVLDHTRDVIFQLDLTNKEYVYVSPSIKNILGFEAEKVKEEGPGFTYDLVHPDDLDKLYLASDGTLNSSSDEAEFRIQNSEGNYIWVSNRRSVIKDDSGEVKSLVGSLRDISERKNYERTIDQSLSEKKILLQEIHHRVKNNLAVISGLLYLQKEEVDGEARTALERAQNRIDSVAMIHEKLYGSDSLSDINLAEYIDELAASIKMAHESEEKEITVEQNLEPVEIEIVDAVTFGLIINELLTNAFQHAFKNRDSGTIKISLGEYNGEKILEVSDTGEGLPEGFDLSESTSLGLTLIDTLTKQIGAEIETISSPDGTTIRITFE